MNNSEIKIFQLEDGQTEILVKFDDDTVWLTQKQISQL
ncbi:MAG TPA: death-on-curing protein, partial [Bacteroidales bacterium]|nr:death-on-curing protein [Bacteroidales bacterium]